MARSMNYIGEHQPQRKNAPKYAECPTCGSQMHHGAKQCRSCRSTGDRSRWSRINVPAMLERHHRFEAALEAGWTLEELMRLARRYKLPTWDEILARNPGAVMTRWWRKGER